MKGNWLNNMGKFIQNYRAIGLYELYVYLERKLTYLQRTSLENYPWIFLLIIGKSEKSIY